VQAFAQDLARLYGLICQPKIVEMPALSGDQRPMQAPPTVSTAPVT
jgi:hypothetical protein